jgi:hypothetical protein
VNADTYELKTILTFERRYVIPTFQRDYEWTEGGQWSLLFDDLEAVADRLEEARHQAELCGEPLTRAEKRVAPHFLGAIVVDGLAHSPGSLDLSAVIDGQQRLTTIQILLRSVLDVLVERGSPRASQLRRLIQNPSDVLRDPDECYKLWPRRRDRDVWRLAMGDELPDSKDHPYFQARRYFSARTRTAINAPNGADRADALVDALLSLFKLVVIDLDDNDDAQVIFEVLNGRQTPLSATDLVKNLLFLRAELNDETELEALYDAHWSYFDDVWWKREIGRGHAARGRRDVLLSTWLTAMSGTEVNVGHLYREVRQYLTGDHKIRDVLLSLSQSAAAFRQILEPHSGLPERMADAYRRTDSLSMTTALPVLVWLRTVAPEQLTILDHARAVTAIDSWIVRRLIIGANTRGYGKRFVEVLKAAQSAASSGVSVADAIETDLLDAATDNLTWPTDDEVENAFVNRQFYDSVAQERIRMLLGAIDRQMHLDHPKGEHPTFDYDALQVEHILPQKWSTYWALEAADESERILSEQARERAKNRIGNLTLVTGPLNIPMSNSPWIDKRAALDEHDNLRLNAGLKSIEVWDEAMIENRAKLLASVACRVWPRPAAVP